MITGSMGCGGSRSAAIEPRYYESRDTESTWLTSTDTETQRAAAGNGTGDSATASENEKTATATAAAGSGQREEKPMTGTRGSSAKEKKLVNTGTQCGRRAMLTDSTQRRPAHRDEVKSKSKKIPQPEGVKSVRPAVNAEVIP
ncbi:BAALC binder of MAP3K1 and KLF4 a [Rhinichthys klamathensis goyatoka]|uniref:BAALC binder of MAP3K1 and KLF4 a n=1 Tax=Rhinichthys klamathensis goyatoka TaxID=3034132 RepID=UPI0024B60D89|nr:BAALC binder of MAP3K1 and KLF4 a [Rhinichthys klamathensis goyatoka]